MIIGEIYKKEELNILNLDAYVINVAHFSSPSSSYFTIEEAEEKIRIVGANISGIVVNHVESCEYKRVVKNYDYFKRHKYMRKGKVRAKSAEKGT